MRLLLLALVIASVFCKVDKGSLSTGNDFVFLSKFCFASSGNGTLTWTAWSDMTGLNLTLYDDDSNSWASVYHSDKSCQEKLAIAARGRPAAVETIVYGKTITITFTEATRPHFWYVAVANCGGNGIEIQWDIEFLNPGNGWVKQFSFDEEGLLAMYLTFTILFLIGSALELHVSWVYIKAKSLHPLIRLLVISLLVETLACLSQLIHYAIYAENGIGAPGLKGLGEILDMGAQLTFMLLLILIAKGWAITNSQLTGKQIIAGLMTIFLLAYIALFIWENVGMDPASTLYVYETVPGIIVLIIRCPIIFGWFLWCIRGSYSEEQSQHKKNFYLVFGLAFALWFFMLPLIVVVATLLEPWVRQKIVTAMYLTVNTLGWGVMCYLLWPTKVADYFKISARGDGLLAGGDYDNL